MFSKLISQIRHFLLISVPERYKKEFEISINQLNVNRAIITCVVFLIMEVFMLAAFFTDNGNKFLEPPYLYYGILYVLMVIAMTIFLLVFLRFKKNVPEKSTGFRFAYVYFVGFILLWCAAITLLDQLSYGQIIVYAVAVICVAVTPVIKPFTMLAIYVFVHALFLGLMPYFQKSDEILFGNIFNGTTFVIFSWVISCMRFRSHVEDFNNRKLIQEKNEELGRINLELEDANHRLERYSQIDSLTGIFNRATFDRKMLMEWERCKRHSIPLSMFLIDIDFFKEYNDNYGHQAGDDCIRRIAGALTECARRSSDVVARFGGDEFAVLLPHMEMEKAVYLAEKIRRRVEQQDIRHEFSPAADHATISLGVNTVIPSNQLTVEEFIEEADRALYEAKNGSRNRIAAGWADHPLSMPDHRL